MADEGAPAHNSIGMANNRIANLTYRLPWLLDNIGFWQPANDDPLTSTTASPAQSSESMPGTYATETTKVLISPLLPARQQSHAS